MTTPQERAAAYWQQLESKRAQDKAKAIRATGNRLAASNDEPEPMVSRHCADTAKEGASHATTTHDDCIDQFLNIRRRQEANAIRLTQQATNRTSVTARKDGQFIRELDERIAAEIRAERRGQP